MKFLILRHGAHIDTEKGQIKLPESGEFFETSEKHVIEALKKSVSVREVKK